MRETSEPRTARWRTLLVRLRDALRNRDWVGFFLETAVVTIGVLIALLGEQLVQDWQWRDKVRTAEQAMRRELLYDNAPQVYQRAVMHPCVQRKLNEIRSAINDGKNRREVADLISEFQLEVVSYDNLAIQLAFASDVASRIPQERQNAYMEAYAVIPFMDRTNGQEALDLARLRALRRIGGTVTEAEASRVLEAVESLRNNDENMFIATRWALPRMWRLGGEIDPVRKQRFMNFARHHYGGCIRDLPTDWPPKSAYHPDNYRPGMEIVGR